MDEARREELRKAALERAAKFNALMLTTIKGHLIVEQAMDAFLEASLAGPKHIARARFRFSDKVLLCRAMSYEDEEHAWNVIGSVNGLRNAIAHGYSDDKQAEAMHTVKSAYLGWLSPEQREGVKKLPDEQIVEGACLSCAGILFTWAERAKGDGGQA